MIERPQMRAVEAIPIQHEGEQLVYLRDPEGFSGDGIAVPHTTYHLLTMFDGDRTVDTLVEAFRTRFPKVRIRSDQVRELIDVLDKSCLLNSDRFQEVRRETETRFRSEKLRPTAHSGRSYPSDPDKLRGLLDGFFEHPDGPGRPELKIGRGPIRAVMAPHIDFQHGGPCFAWAYRALAEAERPSLFVVLGTGHSARLPFVLSRKDFDTPFGPLKADQEVIDRLLSYSEPDLLEDESAHRNEHSIEFQAVFLKYLFPHEDITFVPILCGSFHELIAGNVSPSESGVVQNFVSALKRAVSESERNPYYIAGVDLSHVGQRFGDAEELSEDFIDRVSQTDKKALEAAGSLDAADFFEVIRQVGDQTRVCGTSSIYTMLEAVDSDRAELLRYDRTVDHETQSMVSFASMAFYGETE